MHTRKGFTYVVPKIKKPTLSSRLSLYLLSSATRIRTDDLAYARATTAQKLVAGAGFEPTTFGL